MPVLERRDVFVLERFDRCFNQRCVCMAEV